MNRSNLENMLSLNGGLCQSVKTKDTKLEKHMEPRCRQRSPKPNKLSILSLLDSMISLTQASPDFEAKLKRLAQLVHCDYHCASQYIEARIEIWRELFPVGDLRINAAVTVERKIRKILGKITVECRGKKDNDDNRCQGIGGQNVQNCLRTVDQIIKPEVYQNDEYLSYFLSVLEVNMYCHLHMNKEPLKDTVHWTSRIMEIRKPIGSPDSVSYTKSSAQREETILSSSPLFFVDLKQDPSLYWPRAYDTSPFIRIERETRLSVDRSEYKIRSLREKSLSQTEEKDGYIYLYEVEGNKGVVKLGCTTDPVEKRYEKWTFDCNRKCIGLYPLPITSAKRVPHVRRVEKLCHAQLAHCKIKIDCNACLKEHVEWFQISPEEAINVIKRCSDWMITYSNQAQKSICDIQSDSEDENEQKTHTSDQSLDTSSTAEIQRKFESMTMSEKIMDPSKVRSP